MIDLKSDVPINKISKIVTSSGGGIDREFKSNSISSMSPLPHERYKGRLTSDLSGKKVGRFFVCGVFLVDKTKKGKCHTISWVVRCDCGRYETRKSKSLSKCINLGEKNYKGFIQASRCIECRRTYQYKPL